MIFPRILALILATLVGLSAARAAEGQPQSEAPPEERTVAEKLLSNVQSLEALLKTVASKEEDIAKVQEQLQAATDEVTREELLDRLRKLKEDMGELQGQFEEFAVSVDTSIFEEEEKKKFDWQEEVGNLLQPILAELKNATAESRAISDLRSQIEELDELHAVANEAVQNLEDLSRAERSPALENRLNQELADWRQRRDNADNQRTALRLQLENKLDERKSFLDSTTSYAQGFFRTRGLNLLFGIGAFCAVFFGVRFVNVLLRKMTRPAGKRQSFSSRLGALLFHIVSVLGGLLAMMLVFNMAGDWFLLGIVIIFLLGVAWAGVKTLPQYVETVKLILNIGAVKEDERILFDGLPWKVDTLGFAARMVNPELDGGVQQLPVKFLVGMHSRPNGDKEEWFPCREGDWVELSDGRMGRVAYQTPSTVQLVELGGSQVVYQTLDFLALSPRNLSTNFRIRSTFGIDYKHQAVSTGEVPGRMQEKLAAGLADLVEPNQLKHVKVEFKEAAASSLDYAIEVDVAGEAAAKYLMLQRAVSRLLVDACNENGWEIPFQQITLHQA